MNIEKLIKRYYKKDHFNSSFVYIKKKKMLCNIDIIIKAKNGIPFDYDVVVVNYTVGDISTISKLKLILKMFNCNIKDTTHTIATFQLFNKYDANSVINDGLIFKNNKFIDIARRIYYI